MAQLVRRGARYDDLYDLPEIVIGEIIDGNLYSSRHLPLSACYTKTCLGAWLVQHFDDSWCVLFGLELHFGGDVLVPDIDGWRRERLPDLTDVQGLPFADWVCEVIVPETAHLDRYRKLPLFARNGVEYVWIVDPIVEGLEVYKLIGEHYSLIAVHQGEEIVRAEPFEAVELPLERIWIPTRTVSS